MDASLHNLPEQINHPAHYSHQPNQLVLCPYDGPVGYLSAGCYCSLCSSDFGKGQSIYACNSAICAFKVCIRCSSINARVAYFSHEHPLFFHDRDYPPLCPRSCSYCNAVSHELTFACHTCDFCLHLRCGPLPVAIPFHYAGYDMTLTLTDALTEGVDAEDSWCDVCEEQRDPKHPVYRSSDPPFVATVECVLPQIVRALQGHQEGEVILRRCSDHSKGVVLVSTQSSTDDDAIRVIAEHRTKTLQAPEASDNDYVTLSEDKWDSMTPNDNTLIDRICAKVDEVFRALPDPTDFKFSDKAFEQFKEHVSIVGEIIPGYILTHMADNPACVKVGSNFIPPELVPLYRQLIAKHGDFTANSPLTPIAKAQVLLPLVEIIQVVLGMRMFHFSGGELCTWQWYFEVVRDEVGFEVQFALDYLETVARCCYALKFIKVRDKITADLSEQIERLAKHIEEDKPQVRELKEHHKRAMEGSAFGKHCLFKTSKLQWKSAGEFLGLDPQ